MRLYFKVIYEKKNTGFILTVKPALRNSTEAVTQESRKMIFLIKIIPVFRDFFMMILVVLVCLKYSHTIYITSVAKKDFIQSLYQKEHIPRAKLN